MRLGPPETPDDFWESEAFEAASVAQHMGWVLRTYRKHPDHVARYGRDGIPQETVGNWLGLSQPQVSRFENGPPCRDLDTLSQWARTLRVPPWLLWFRLPGEPTGRRAGGNATTGGRFPSPLDRPSPGRDLSAMRAFRAADRQVGGGHLYTTVVRYLESEVGPRLFGAIGTRNDPSPFAAAAALTEMAGWMAHDAGRHEVAHRHFEKAGHLADAGDDTVLGAQVLGSQSHLSHHRGCADEGVVLARQGAALLDRGPSHPPLAARLLALQARGHASLGRTDECLRLLRRAESILDVDRTSESSSPWVSRFDEGSLASEMARCMRHLGDRSEEGRQAGRILELRPDAGSRSRALGQLMMVGVLVARGCPEEACALAHEALEATQSLGSYVVIEQLMNLRQLLDAYGSGSAVLEFLARLDEAVTDRAWLLEWLRPAGNGHG